MKKPKFQHPPGMHDILPEDQIYFRKISEAAEKLASFYGFAKIDTPILERTELFLKGSGQGSDVVQKQMYNLKTKGGDYLTLRPEFTPGVARAFIEHGMFNLPQPVKLYSIGPVFRYEHPQAGRYRQFHQINFEVFGEKDSVIDSQIILIFYNILKELKLKNLIIDVNSIGDSQCRPFYKKILVNYFKARETSLCSDCKIRLRVNPLRILDCKEEKCQVLKAQVPQIIDHLCEECHNHFKEVLEFLDEVELPYRLNPYLVRGLDYYTKTVFEIYEDSEEGRKIGALAAGGRYDTLVKILGGKETPACGGALGIERIMTLMKERNMKFTQRAQPAIFLAQLGNLAKRKSFKILEDLRKEKIFVYESLGRNSLKVQLAKANRMGIKYVLILGQKEALEGTIIIRDMESGRQEIVKLDKIFREIKRRLKNKN